MLMHMPDLEGKALIFDNSLLIFPSLLIANEFFCFQALKLMLGLWWFRWSWLSKYGSTIHHGQPNHLSVKLSILLTSSLKEEKKHTYPVLLLLLWHIILSFWYVRKNRLLTYQLTDGRTYKCSHRDGGRIIAPTGISFSCFIFFNHLLQVFIAFMIAICL